MVLPSKKSVINTKMKHKKEIYIISQLKQILESKQDEAFINPTENTDSFQNSHFFLWKKKFTLNCTKQVSILSSLCYFIRFNILHQNIPKLFFITVTVQRFNQKE